MASKNFFGRYIQFLSVGVKMIFHIIPSSEIEEESILNNLLRFQKYVG